MVASRVTSSGVMRQMNPKVLLSNELSCFVNKILQAVKVVMFGRMVRKEARICLARLRFRLSFGILGSTVSLTIRMESWPLVVCTLRSICAAGCTDCIFDSISRWLTNNCPLFSVVKRQEKKQHTKMQMGRGLAIFKYTQNRER